MEPIEKEFDTESTDNVVCPYCGSEHRDNPESNYYYDQNFHDYDCEYCGETFELVAFIQVSWTTMKKEERVDVLPN